MAANRVATLGRVHRHLHTSDRLESVEFKQYLEELCDDLAEVASSEFAERFLSAEGAELEIPRGAAVPLGFIASELITNSIKYAKGKITVSLQAMPNGDAALSVSDDGPGLPEAFDPAATNGLGMKIIAASVRQIHGELKIAKGDNATERLGRLDPCNSNRCGWMNARCVFEQDQYPPQDYRLCFGKGESG